MFEVVCTSQLPCSCTNIEGQIDHLCINSRLHYQDAIYSRFVRACSKSYHRISPIRPHKALMIQGASGDYLWLQQSVSPKDQRKHEKARSVTGPSRAWTIQKTAIFFATAAMRSTASRLWRLAANFAYPNDLSDERISSPRCFQQTPMLKRKSQH